MSEATVIVRPYAKAVFELAESTGSVGQWEQMLLLASQLVESKLGGAYVQSPLYTKVQKVDLFLSVFPKQLDASFVRLLEVMSSFNRLFALPALYQAFVALRKQADNQLDVTFVSAKPLSDKSLSALKNAVSKRTGRSLLVHTHIEPNLLGGVIVRTEDFILDGSIRGRLSRLTENLNI